MRKYALTVLLGVAGLSLLLTGCQLFPEEEAFPASPIIRSYETSEYKEAKVMRGNLSKTVNISCRYRPAKKENYSFKLGGEYIDKVYFAEGEQVKAGDLLAELVLDTVSEQISQLEYDLKVLHLKKEHNQENWNLELRLLAVKYLPLYGEELLRDESYIAAKAAIDAEFSKSIQDIEDSIYIKELRLKNQKEEKNNRMLFSGIDGTVTSVKPVADGQRSVEDEVLISVSDMTSAVFIATSNYVDHLPVGTEVIINMKDKDLAAITVMPEELGLDPAEIDSKSVYLRLLKPEPTLEDGDSGKIEILTDFRTNALYVNKDAVKIADGRQFVYVLNEDGLKVMKDVVAGVEFDHVIEIISGLNEGDSVIVE